MGFAHAQHNESICDHLLEQDKWNDWVVTTAFYSALHYVECRIFPFKSNGIEYKNFDQYYVARKEFGDTSKNKHDSKVNLVFQRLRKAHPAYRYLKDNCLSARYNQYNVSLDSAKEARKKLAIVKDCCVSTSGS